MSLEVLLIPIGLAAYAAFRESRSTDLCEKCKATRIEDQQLLVEALTLMGGESFVQAEGRVTAHLASQSLTFQRVGTVFLGRVDGADDQTPQMLASLDGTVGGIMQRRTVEALRSRASEMGLTLIAERADDGSIQMVFEQA